MAACDPAKLAAAIIQRANDGYHQDPDQYPPYAPMPWDDRIVWSSYVQLCAEKVIAEAIAARKDPQP